MFDTIEEINAFLDEKVEELPLNVPLEGDDLILYKMIARAQKAICDLSIPLVLLEYGLRMEIGT